MIPMLVFLISVLRDAKTLRRELELAHPLRGS